MADRTGRPDPRDNPHNVIDAGELDDIIRHGDTPPETIEREGERSEDRGREPEIRREDEGRGEGREESRGDQSSELRSALDTINRMQDEMRDLRTQFTRTRGPEPSIEHEEVLPGVRLPRDRERWPIKLTEKDIEKFGIDPQITPGLNVLANAFYAFVVDTLPGYTTQQVQSSLSQREQAAGQEARFFEDYPDLKDHRDLLQVVEQRVWPEYGRQPRPEYMKTLATETRKRLATMRGVSLQEYERGISSTSRPSTISRASSTSGGGRGNHRPRPTNEFSDMEDMGRR